MVCYRFDCYCILPCFATLLYIHFGFPLPDHKGHTMKAQNNIRHTGISTQNNIRHTGISTQNWFSYFSFLISKNAAWSRSSPPACSLPQLCWDSVPGITKTALKKLFIIFFSFCLFFASTLLGSSLRYYKDNILKLICYLLLLFSILCLNLFGIQSQVLQRRHC